MQATTKPTTKPSVRRSSKRAATAFSEPGAVRGGGARLCLWAAPTFLQSRRALSSNGLRPRGASTPRPHRSR